MSIGGIFDSDPERSTLHAQPEVYSSAIPGGFRIPPATAAHFANMLLTALS
ncbi:MAG: hypothetical protein R3C97_00725 [Geminicoccaceae bacterium]